MKPLNDEDKFVDDDLAGICFSLAGDHEPFMGVPHSLILATAASIRLNSLVTKLEQDGVLSGGKLAMAKEAGYIVNAFLMRGMCEGYDKEMPEAFDVVRYYINHMRDNEKREAQKNGNGS